MSPDTLETLLLLAAGALANVAAVWGVLHGELREVRRRIDAVRDAIGMHSNHGDLR